VVFASEDDAFAAGIFENRADSIGVEGGGIEDGWILIAIAPFFVGESIHRKVKEIIEAQLAPTLLREGGKNAIGCGWRRLSGKSCCGCG
jgi:hypothetical protein